MDIKKKIKTFPDSCGVYLMKSKKGITLYVGKANSLRKRIRSYFNQSSLSEKNHLLMEKVAKIDFIECSSPEQALILEAALIKEKKPRYNVSLKDNKSYPYVEVTREQYPRVLIVRPKEKKESLYFGPYTDAGSLRRALKAIRRAFPYCSCRSKSRRKSCLYYHLGLCPGPCLNKVSLAKYGENIKAIKKILQAKRPEVLSFYRRKMKKEALAQNFERAAWFRDKIYALENIYSRRPETHELIDLKERLNLPKLPLIIEAIDASGLGDKDAVGAVVVFKDGVAHKSSYRRFLIKSTRDINDYQRIHEVVFRRYLRLQKEKKVLPDLIVVDGGAGQVSSAKKALLRLGLDVPLLGLAKLNEEIWLPGEKKPKIIAKDAAAMHLLQRARDQAHHFAHQYHLLRRRKQWNPKTKKAQRQDDRI